MRVYIPATIGWTIETRPFDSLSIGRKAEGLSLIPVEWRPEYIVLSSELLARFIESAENIGLLALDVLSEFEQCSQLIVRSSVSNEWIHARGRYDSAIVGATSPDLSAAIITLYNSARRILLDGGAAHSDRCALIVQRYLPAQATGHLSNEYRHAQRKVDFLYEAESCSDIFGLESQRPYSFRLPRPLKASVPGILDLSRFENLEETLKHAAEWLAATLGRGHAEWVVSHNRLYLVQFDREQEPANILPLQSWVEDASKQFNLQLEAFKRIDYSGAFDRWRKTRSHRIVAQAGLRVPPIYLLEGQEWFDALLNGTIPQMVMRDLSLLVSLPAIIRLDVDAQNNDWSNLPAKGPVRCVEIAIEFLKQALAQAQARSIGADELAIVIHHFIPAKAAAWSTANPDDSRVKIDSIWGLPDGLQAYPYDTSIVDLTKEIVAETLRFKDEFLDVDNDGEWIVRRTPPRLARQPTLTETAALMVARGSLEIAKVRGKATRVMWFIATDERAGIGTEVAWICIDEDNEAGFWMAHEAPIGSQQTDLVTRLQRRISLGNVRRLADEEDLMAFRANPAAYDAGGHCVLFRPAAPLLRRREFLREVAEVVSTMQGWYLVLEGSLLAHAPYQLRSLGLRRIISVWEFARPPKATYVGKLVRDKIPEAIEQRGEHPVTVELLPDALAMELRAKLVEEALEVFNADEESAIEELADVLSVFRALIEMLGTSMKHVEEAEQRKSERRGGFTKGLYLSSTTPSPNLSRKQISETRGVVRRLRSRNGIALSLIPPTHGKTRDERMRFSVGDRSILLTVEYRESEVLIYLDDSSTVDNPDQLTMFALLSSEPKPK